MANHQLSSVRYSRHGVENRNEGGDPDHAVIHGRMSMTDSTGGADSRGQDQSRSASGSFSHGQQQPTGLKMLKEIPPGNDCEVRLKIQRGGMLMISQVGVPIHLSVPEWIHMGRSNSIQHRLIELLKKEDINILKFDTKMTVDLSAEIWGNFHQDIVDTKVKRIHNIFTEMKGKLQTQCYEVPEYLHDTALYQLQKCKVNQSCEGTYWKSSGGHFVFVADVGCKERVFGEFSSILCSLASAKEEVGESASNNDGKISTMEKKAFLDNTAGKVGVQKGVHLKENFTLSPEMNNFVLNNTAAQQYMIQKLLENGISCEFDNKEEFVAVTLTSQDPSLKGMLQKHFSSFLNQKVRSLQGKKILEFYNVEELQKLLHQYHKSFEGKLVVLPHKQSQEVILLGTDDAVKAAESYLSFLVDEFANAEKRVLHLRHTDAKPNMSEIEKISQKLTTGCVKVTVEQNEPFIVKVFGKRCSIDEFCQFLGKKYDYSLCFTSPIMEPQLSLLREKSAAETYLKEEATKIGLKVQVDTKEKRYVVESQRIPESDSQKFLSQWHETHTYPLDHSLREETTENIRSYFRKCKSLDDSKVILKLDGDAVTIVATADVIASAKQCLREWEMKNQTQIQQEDYVKSNTVSSAPTESSPCSSKSDVANPTSQESDLASQEATGVEADHIFVQENGKNILKCRLGWPLTKYCREIMDCKNYVKDEFKSHGFDIQINRVCDEAKITLESSEDVSIARDLLTCFGAQIKSLENKSPTATDVRKMLKEKSSDAEKIVIYHDTRNKTLVLFGMRKLVDSVSYTLEDILDDFIQEDFCVTLTDEEHEQMPKGTLQEIEKEFVQGKIKISQKSGMLQVSGARFVLEKCRWALLEKLSKIQSAMKRDGDIKKISVTQSKHVMDLLKKKEIMDEIWVKFSQKGFSISLEGKVCFGALSFAALIDGEQLLKNLIIEKKYPLRHEPIFQFMSGEQICQILTERHGGKLTVCVDERHDLHIACPSEVWATVRNDFITLQDQFITEDIDISEKKLGEKRSSDHLTVQLFELDIKLMGKAKVIVDGGTLMIVTTRDMLHYVKKKVDQLLLKIETESEINKQNPNVCVNLSALKLKLLEQPGVLDYINQKVRKKHLQMTFDIGKSCITVYGLSNEFADAGKDLIESCFETKTYALLKYTDLDPYQLEEFESLISEEESVHSGRIATEVNTKKGTITFVCTDDVFQAVEKMVTENLKRICQYAKLTYRREVISYIHRFCSQKLQAVETNDVSIHTSFDGEIGSFEITGQKQEIQKAKKKIEELCADVSIETFAFDSDDYFDILETDQGHHAVQNTEENMKSVISLRMPGSYRQVKNESALPVEEYGAVCEKLLTRPTVGIDERELLKLNTDVIAVAYAEDRLSKMVYDGLTHAGVISQWHNISATSQKRGGNKNQQGPSVCFGDKKLFKAKHIAFCHLPSWEQAGNDKEKQKVRETICSLLQECIKRSASEVVIVIAVSKSHLFKRLAKQIIYQAKESLKTLTLKVSLLCEDECMKDLLNIMKTAESDTTSQMSTSKIKNIFKSTKKTTLPKGPAKVNRPKAILVEVGSLENQKVDVIVSSSNCHLDLTRGGAAKILNEVTNGELQKECVSSYPRGIKLGVVATTGSHGLPCKAVFHGALTPYIEKENEKLTPEKKQSKLQFMSIFIHRCLKSASYGKYESIAFPALGTGNLYYPVDEVAPVMFRTVEEFFKVYPSSTVKKVVFVLHEKDYDVIQIFKTEWLAHLYLRNVTGTLYPAKEERFHHKNIMIQVIEGDDCKPGAGADEILCFWREEQLSDFKLHPYLGSHASSLQWDVYGPELREKKVKIMPGGTFFPSKTIVNVVIDESQTNQEELFLKAMTMAANSRCYVLQIPLLTAGDQQYLRVLADCLFKCISDELNGVLCVINILADTRNYSTLVQMFKDQLLNQPEEENEAYAQRENMFTMLYHTAAGWVKDKYSYFTSSSNGAENERNRAALVIAAESDSVCKAAYSSILEKVKMINPTQPASKKSDFASGDYEDSAGYVHLTEAVPGPHGERKPFINCICKAEIQPSYLLPDNWSSVENEMKRKYGVEIKYERGTTYISGNFEDPFQARQFLSEVEGYSGVTAGEAEINRETTRKHTGDSHELSEDQLKAAQHLIGESTFHECCDVEMFPPGYAKLHFVDRGELSSTVQQRILGVIQEEMIINAADRDKAGDVSKDAMKGFNDVYIKYHPDRNTMILFAEDWDKMARAKKRVLLKFGQSKVSSRGGRRFAGSKGADASSSGKMSFDKHTGCAKGRHITVRVYQADITNLKVDVIVNAANGFLSHGAGVARAIANAAGPEMTSESLKYYQERGQIKVSHLAVTGAGRLPYKMVFHAVGPEWYNYTDKHQCLEDLCCTILRCLCEAEKQRIASIAIPSISSAIFKVPREDCARMYVRALKSFDQVVENGSLGEVHFIDVSDKMVSLIQEELQNRWCNPGEEDDQKRDLDFINDCLRSDNSSTAYKPSAKQKHEVQQDDKAKSFGRSLSPPGPNVLPAGFFKFSDGVSLNIFKRDIFEMKTDAFVSWEVAGLYACRPLTKALIDKGGDDYQTERRKHLKAKKGAIVQTSPGKLNQGCIFHAVVGDFPKPGEFSGILGNVLRLCVEKECTKVLLPVFGQISKVSGKSENALFTEAVVDALIDMTSQKNKPSSLHVFIVDNKQDVVDKLIGLLNQYLISTGLVQEAQTSMEKDAKSTQGSDKDCACPICLEPLTIPSKLKCGHAFCKECIDRAFKEKKVCPICKVVCGTITGIMPPGEMSDEVKRFSLSGYEGCDTICITYKFKDGKQTSEHPHPGKYYTGFTRYAFLPDTPEGRKVLALLNVAWKRRLTFTVGTSVTMGGRDRLTWNEIHHKTNTGGGPTNHGYPDPEYLQRVQEELAAQGVTEQDLGSYV